ncbi:hypothetical protein ACIG87_26550 [Micromonospora sp. NPDC051925]|uniref:hypothetical protein n=1 Tax=Micromonospora sp. NPDC051925 TaxID=3364288 RepID=UPI0037C76CA1
MSFIHSFEERSAVRLPLEREQNATMIRSYQSRLAALSLGARVVTHAYVGGSQTTIIVGMGSPGVSV